MPDPILNPALYTRAHVFGRGAPTSPNFVEQGFGGGQAPQPPSWEDFIKSLFQKIGYPGGTVPPQGTFPGAAYGGGQAPQPQPQALNGPNSVLQNFGGGQVPQPPVSLGQQPPSWPTPPAPQPSFPGAAFGGGGPVPQPSAVGGPQPSWPTPPPPSMLHKAVVDSGPDEGVRARASGGPGAPGAPAAAPAPTAWPSEGRGGGPGAPAMGGTVAPADPRLQYGVPMPPSRPPDLSPLFNQNQGAGMGMTPFMLAREGANWGGGRDGHGG